MILLAAACLIAGCTTAVRFHGNSAGVSAPVEVRIIGDGDELLVLGSAGQRAVILDRTTGEPLRYLSLPAAASGAAVSGDVAYITTNEPAGRVLKIELKTGRCMRQFRVGHSPTAPVVSPEGGVLCVANRFDHTVSIVNPATGDIRFVKVIREPVALTLSPDGKRLYVANHLPEVRVFLDDENPYIAAEVSVIDVGRGEVIDNIELPNGSQGLRDIAMSPNGRHVVVTHILSHYTVPTRSLERGAMNMNAITLIDARSGGWLGTVILDDPDRGAANPWAVGFSRDGGRLLVTHAGTGELSVIDFDALLGRVGDGSHARDSYGEAELHTMDGIRRRIALGVSGPRTLTVDGRFAYVAGYFSDDLAVVELGEATSVARVLQLVDKPVNSAERLGERYFNDASLCRQQWQSCGTCHPDGRSDVMYWDLLNDGMGNTKNTKSLLMSALTPPAMWRGVRTDAGQAVAAGIHHILFTEVEPEQAVAIEAYLLSMPATPSPFLDSSTAESPKPGAECAKCHYPHIKRGRLTDAALRGKAIFEGKAGCTTCHPHPAFTTMQQVDPGLGSGVLYDVPTLVEVWRTAPYLHSGDALTLRETIVDFNFLQKRGRTGDLTESELDDLIEYLKSL